MSVDRQVRARLCVIVLTPDNRLKLCISNKKRKEDHLGNLEYGEGEGEMEYDEALDKALEGEGDDNSHGWRVRKDERRGFKLKIQTFKLHPELRSSFRLQKPSQIAHARIPTYCHFHLTIFIPYPLPSEPSITPSSDTSGSSIRTDIFLGRRHRNFVVFLHLANRTSSPPSTASCVTNEEHSAVGCRRSG